MAELSGMVDRKTKYAENKKINELITQLVGKLTDTESDTTFVCNEATNKLVSELKTLASQRVNKWNSEKIKKIVSELMSQLNKE